MARGRPPTPPGTFGKITCKQLGPDVWQAHTYFRFRNGESRRVYARGPSQTGAERALKKRLADLVTETQSRSATMTRATKFETAAKAWLDHVDNQVQHRVLSPGTLRTYTSLLNVFVLPQIGQLRLGELDVARYDELICAVRDSTSLASARTVRTILSGVLGVAVRHGALEANPIRSVSRLLAGADDGKDVEAMTLAQLNEMRERLARFAAEKSVRKKGRRLGTRALVWSDLPDLVEAMLALGVRIGEILAVQGSGITPGRNGQRTTVIVDAHVVRSSGQGLQRMPGRKKRSSRQGKARVKVYEVPTWSAPMFARRKLASGGGLLFRSMEGGLLDPSNTIKRLREALDASGYQWVTSHVWRKTVSSTLNEAGLSLSEIADQLDNTQAVAERHYVAPKATNQRAAAALESIAPPRQPKHSAN
jgi:integrase